MQFRPFEPNIEILGHAVSFVSVGFRIVPSVGLRFLTKQGILAPGAALDPNGWYSQARWLAAFEDIANEVGTNVIYETGRQLGSQAWAPDQMKDVRTAIQFLDFGYHRYHRKNGRVMADDATGKLTEGIGHYSSQVVPNRREIISVCENPYPCRFDHGLISGLIERFQADARVLHDEARPCRQRGADSCTYRITW